MPADFTPRDELGRPIDVERYFDRKADDSEAQGLHVERCEPPADNLIAFAVRDNSGRVRGMLALEMDALEIDLPDRLLARVQGAASAAPERELKLVV